MPFVTCKVVCNSKENIHKPSLYASDLYISVETAYALRVAFGRKWAGLDNFEIGGRVYYKA